METFIKAKPFADNPNYEQERKSALRQLEHEIRDGLVDPPVIGLLKEIGRIPHCFTLQSCYGHFIHKKQPNKANLESLVRYAGEIESVHYRIAYIAFCIKNTGPGRELYADILDLVKLDPDYIQFGSASWFWERNINSYVIQIEPGRSKTKDSVLINMDEALHIERVRDRFFDELPGIVQKHLQMVE